MPRVHRKLGAPVDGQPRCYALRLLASTTCGWAPPGSGPKTPLLVPLRVVLRRRGSQLVTRAPPGADRFLLEHHHRLGGAGTLGRELAVVHARSQAAAHLIPPVPRHRLRSGARCAIEERPHEPTRRVVDRKPHSRRRDPELEADRRLGVERMLKVAAQARWAPTASDTMW